MNELGTADQDINRRIVYLLEYLGVSRYKCNQDTGISEMVLYNIYSDKNKPSYDTIWRLMTTYNVNGDWLIKGIGEMLNKTQSSEKKG
jgi:transcriptional regulator with XRE-family HTH domain